MKNKRYTNPLFRLILICLWIATINFAFAADNAKHEKPARISKTFFTGNEVLSNDQLNQTIRNAGPKYFWTRNPIFHPEELEKDLLRLKQSYKAEGYYDVNAAVTEEWLKEGRKLRLHYRIYEGSPIIVDKFALELIDENLAVSARDKLLENFRENALLKEGEVFALDDYQETQTNIMKAAGNHSYALAQIRAKTVISKRDLVADVQLVVTLGPRCYIDKIEVKGLDKVRRDEIEDEILFAEDEPIETEKLSQTQRNIYDLGYFESVSIIPKPREDKKQRLVIEIRTAEKDFRRFRFGIGYGTEERIRTSISWEKEHLWHGPRTIHVGAYYSFLEYGAEVVLKQRFWPYKQASTRGKIFFNRQTTDAFNLLSIGAKLTMQFDITKQLEGAGGYSINRQRYSEVADDISEEDEELLPPVPPDEWFYHSYLFGYLRHDATDDRFNPHKGGRVILTGQVASKAIASDASYWKSTLEGNLFIGLSKRWVLALRALGGVAQPIEDSLSVLPEERLYSGGTRTVRGYKYQHLGPLDGDKDPIGGNSQFEGNVEVRYPLYKKILGGVVFLDMGNVWTEEFHFEMGDLHYSTGAGLRVYMPIGPIRLDFGYKLNPATEDESLWRIHFSIKHIF